MSGRFCPLEASCLLEVRHRIISVPLLIARDRILDGEASLPDTVVLALPGLAAVLVQL